MRSRTHAFTGHGQIEDISSQMRLAEAIVNTETAETLREDALQKVTAATNRRDEITTKQRGRLRLESAFIATLCKRSIDLLIDSAGGNALSGEGSAKCPFHDDRHASFSVNSHSGLWFCHACNVGGTTWVHALALIERDR